MIKKILGIGFIVLVVFIGLWYYFTFKYVPKGEVFDIRYENVELISYKGHPETEKAEISNHGLYTRTNFTTNKEEVVYKFTATNDGTLEAKLKYNPIYLRTDMYFKKHVSYHISYLDDSEIKKGDTLNPGETKTFKVTISYSSSDLVTQNSQFYESLVWLVYVRK